MFEVHVTSRHLAGDLGSHPSYFNSGRCLICSTVAIEQSHLEAAAAAPWHGILPQEAMLLLSQIALLQDASLSHGSLMRWK